RSRMAAAHAYPRRGIVIGRALRRELLLGGAHQLWCQHRSSDSQADAVEKIAARNRAMQTKGAIVGVHAGTPSATGRVSFRIDSRVRDSITSPTARYAMSMAASVCELPAASAFAIAMRPNGFRPTTHARSSGEDRHHSTGSESVL